MSSLILPFKAFQDILYLAFLRVQDNFDSPSNMSPTMSPTIPNTMKAIVIDKPGAPWALKEVPVPQPSAGEVLVKVLACGVCLSDYFLQQGAFGTHPRIPGHEIIGTIVGVGDGEKRWKVGQKVGGGWHGAHDGTCKGCGMGLYQMCEGREVNGVTRDGGCEYH